MITRIDLTDCETHFKDQPFCADCIDRLLKERDAAQARAEAYRELAIQLVDPDGTILEAWVKEDVDGQAQRILEERNKNRNVSNETSGGE